MTLWVCGAMYICDVASLDSLGGGGQGLPCMCTDVHDNVVQRLQAPARGTPPAVQPARLCSKGHVKFFQQRPPLGESFHKLGPYQLLTARTAVLYSPFLG